VNTKLRSTASKIATLGVATTLLAGAVAGAAVAQGSGKKGDIDLHTPTATINHGGSSFVYPFVAYMTTGNGAGRYNNPSVTFGTDTAAGSGDGRNGVAAGTYSVGYSDYPMNVLAGSAPTGYTSQGAINNAFIQVPVALGGGVVGYHLPGLNNLKLSAQVIADIYNGSITKWNDQDIADLNKGVSLPDKAIKVLYRSASSGTTYAFTNYLNVATRTSPAASGAVMEGTGKAWKATNTVGESNNAAMASDLAAVDGAVGYLEYSYVLANPTAIQVAQLQDAAGAWIKPSLTTIANAATAYKKSLSTTSFSIVYGAGKDVWPFATYVWAIVKKNQTDSSAGEATVKYLDYISHGGQTKASSLGYVPLPTAAQAYTRTQLLQVKNGSTVLLTRK
jgi:phosphate transport system substrate-binding protein